MMTQTHEYEQQKLGPEDFAAERVDGNRTRVDHRSLANKRSAAPFPE